MNRKSLPSRALNKILSKFNLFVNDKNLEEICKNLKNEYGYNLTKILKKPVDKQQKPIPWFTYPAIEFLQQFSLKDKMIFEWGSGHSSLFFATRCKEIISIESNEEWHKYISQNLFHNQQNLLRQGNSFVDSIKEFSLKFDIIIIDSLKRYNCAENALNYLNDGGLIILDNSDWYPNTSKFLREMGNLLEVDMHGFGPINDYSWTTSFYFDRNFNFQTNNNYQPSFSLAAINQQSPDDSPS